jgi:acetolactate synthase small subunit
VIRFSIIQFASLVHQIVVYISTHQVTGFQLHGNGDPVQVVFEYQDYGDVIEVDRSGNVTIKRESYAD